jgi:hypothetical protein
MSFDARSLERLRQLGRTLPQRLPAPEPPTPAADPAPSQPGAGGGRHRLETETDPEALFHELMRASADGHAPPHLLERLRELESRRARPSAPAELQTREAQAGGPNRQPRPPAGGKGRQRQQGRPDPRLAREHGELYTAFQQLLLEDDEI